jgi:hypothetical protein
MGQITMGLTLPTIVRFLSGSVEPGNHVVVIDGQESEATCTRASVRTVFGLGGLEIVVDYAYELGGTTSTLSSRLRRQGLGSGGREQIKFNGKDVTADDVITGFEGSDTLNPVGYIEFRFVAEGQNRSIKFVASLRDFQ